MLRIFTFISVVLLTFSANALDPDLKFKDSPVLTVKDTDFIVGSKDAQITIIEYSSLTCPHCGYFHQNVFEELTKEYLDKGQVKYVLRDFPLNAPALLASKISHCAGEDRYLNFISTFFEWQSIWAFTKNYPNEIQKIAALGGITGDKYKECSQDKTKENFILQRAMEANKELDISETPTFFIDGEKFTGARDIDFFRKTLDAKIAALPPSKPKAEKTAKKIK